MKTIRITQNDVGKFNLFGNEDSLSFGIGLFEDGNIIEENGVKAILCYSGEPYEQSDFEDAYDNLDYVFKKCFEYSRRVFGSTDYEARCLLFFRLYKENFEEISKNYKDKKQESIRLEIERLQEQLGRIYLPDLVFGMEDVIKREIEKYKKWIDSNKKEAEQYKEGSDGLAKLENKNEDYAKKIKELRKLIIK